MLLMLALLPTGALAEADTDDRGVPLPLEAPERVVCLYGSYAEAWLQAGGALVGVTDDAAKERGIELTEDVRIIGTNKEPNLELIVALAPVLPSPTSSPCLKRWRAWASAALPSAWIPISPMRE